MRTILSQSIALLIAPFRRARVWLLALVLAPIWELTSGSSTALSATYMWNSTAIGANWNDASNWGGVVPSGSDDAFITNGGTATITQPGATCSTLSLGDAAAGTGFLKVANGGLTVGQDLVLGNSGNGSMYIANGIVQSTHGYLGYNPGSSGTATVTGAGSTWNVGEMFVGYSGNGMLNITNGGVVNDSLYELLGDSGGSGVVNVSGGGSTWNTGSIGFSLVNGSLNITAGGIVDSFVVPIVNPSASVTVDGAGSAWNTGGLTLSGTLNISNGGAVNSAGWTTIATGSPAMIHFGPGGGTLSAQTIFCGTSAQLAQQLSGTGSIVANGLISDQNLVFNAPASLVQTTSYTGPGQNVALTLDLASAPSNNGGLGAGYSSSASMIIQNGVAVRSAWGYLGYNPGSSGTATVTGAGSTWNVGEMFVGYSGNGMLNITNGGVVNDSLYELLGDSGGSGVVNVSGGGSTWNTGSIGFSLVNGSLNITAGGIVDSFVVPIVNPSASVTVDGAGSAWNTGGLTLSGTLNISNGGAVNSAGWTTIATGSPAMIHFGPGGGTLSAQTIFCGTSAQLAQQLSGTGSIVANGLISDQNLVFNAPASLVQTTSYTGPGQNVALTLDLASAPSNNGGLGAGYSSSASMIIQNGVAVRSAWGYLGYNPGSSGTATVTGAGSTWNVGEMFVGYSGNGMLNITNGGVVNDSLYELLGDNGGSGVVNVSGSGSTWNTGSIGFRLVNGSLNITAGGVVNSFNESNISVNPSASVTVDGTGSAWNTGGLTLSGTLNISNGGAVNCTGDSTIANGGVLDLNGGILRLYALPAGAGTFNFAGGTLAAIAPWSSAENINITATIGACIVDTTSGSMLLSGVLSGSGGLTKVGVGTLTLAGPNTYSGGTVIGGGLVNVAWPETSGVLGPLGVGQVSFAGGALQYSAANQFDYSSRIVDSSGPIQLDTNGQNVAFAGNISSSNTGGFTKSGSGTLSLAGANAYLGGTSVGGGTLALDFSQPGAPTSNIIYNGVTPSSLTIAAGVVSIQGKGGASNSQTFNGLTVNPGGSTIVLTAAASNSVVLNLGVITHNAGGTINFILPSGTQSATNGITTTTPNTNGILGGYATVSGTDWATSSGTAGNIVAYTGYTSGDLGTLASDATLNVKPTGVQTAVTSAKSFYSLNLTGTQGVMISGSGSLTLISGGLIGNTSGIITGGTLAGSPGGELLVATPQDLTIESAIAANILAKTGPGKLTLLAANNNSGTTLVGNGVLLLSNANAAQSTTVNVGVDNGLQFAHGIGSFNVGSIAGGGALALADTGGSAVTVIAGGNNASTTYSGVISGPGTLAHAGTGALLLTASNGFSGGVIIGAGTVGSVYPLPGIITFTNDPVLQAAAASFSIPGNVVISASATGVIDTNGFSVPVGGAISGAGGLTKTGAGTLVLTNSNSISGPTEIDQGTLELGNSAALQNSTVSVNSGNGLTFAPNISNFSLGGLSGNSPLPLTDGGGTPINVTLGSNNQDTTYSGTISGGGTLTKAGTGSLDLTGSNSWTGGLTFDPGIVAFNSDAALGAPANRITFVGSGTLRADGPIALSSARNISIGSGATASFDPNGNTLVVGGVVSGSGTLAVAGSGTLVLANSNNYAGGTFVNVGALEAMTPASLPGAFTLGKLSIADGAALILAVGGSPGAPGWTATSINSLLAYAQFSAGATFSLDSSGGGFDIGSINSHGIALAIADGDSLAVGGSGVSTFSGRITGGGSLTKLGPGTLVLSPGAPGNDYSGGTDVLDGTLIIASPAALGDGTDLNLGDLSFFSAVVPNAVDDPRCGCPGSGLHETAAVAPAISPVAVPEPSALALLAAWLPVAGLSIRSLRRTSNAKRRSC